MLVKGATDDDKFPMENFNKYHKSMECVIKMNLTFSLCEAAEVTIFQRTNLTVSMPTTYLCQIPGRRTTRERHVPGPSILPIP